MSITNRNLACSAYHTLENTSQSCCSTIQKNFSTVGKSNPQIITGLHYNQFVNLYYLYKIFMVFLLKQP